MGRNHAPFGRGIQLRKVVIDTQSHIGFSCSSSDKEAACNTGDLGSIPGSERSSEKGNGNSLQYSCLENPIDRDGEGNGTPLQYSCLENPMDGGAW